jgi:hypothetical protein
MTQELTALQRSVIQRLRLMGHIAIAYEAHACWTTGECVEASVGEDISDDALRAEFMKANEQVVRE